MFSSNTSQQSEGYQIQRSLRFNSADSAYLNRTPASAGNRRIWTWSAWVKRQNSAIQSMFGAYDGVSTYGCSIYFFNDSLAAQYGGSALNSISSPAVYRDYSAWYHIVWAVDATAGTQTQKLYVNGVQVATAAAPNADAQINSTISHTISSASSGFSGYMTEVNFIDGQALTPSSFGYYDFNTGVWTPMKYVGTYGTNGFYLNFSDNSNTTATTLGKDYSGNGNNWTPNNFSVSAGAGNDSLVDVPTAWGTDTGVGGTVRGNYATMNPVNAASSGVSLVNGNLDATTSASTGIAYATFGVSSGKWYWEVTPGAGSDWMIGISKEGGLFDFRTTNGFAYYSNGQKFTNNTGSSYGSAFGASNVIGVGLDMDAGTLTFFRDGVSQGVAFSGLSGTFFPSLQNPGAGTVGYIFNFGQRPFAYTAPSGFKALCTQNLPTPTVGATASTQAGKYFNAVTYTAPVNSGTLTVTGVGFQPDFTWWKTRSSTDSNVLMNVLSGSNKYLLSNSTNAEATYSGIWTPSSDGFTASAFSYSSNQTYVAWNWKANGAGVTNTAGSITSTVSANTTSGFSVVKWNGSGNATIGHGLGVAPSMYIVKPLNNTSQWYVYFRALGAGKYLQLNLTATEINDTAIWQNTAPTSTVFSIGSGINVNNMVAYCFAEVPGFSKFGSYTGNGSTDGPFVYCGFRPAYVMVKCSSPGGSDTTWVVKDKLRAAPYNPQDGNLYPNLANAEDTISTVYVDFLSNGFKIRGTYGGINGSSQTYIFAAFAEAPQKFALAR